MDVVLSHHIPDHEESALRLLRKTLLRWWATPALSIKESQRVALEGAQTIQEVAEISPMAAQWAVDEVEARYWKRQETKQTQWNTKTAMRARYMPLVILDHREAKPQGWKKGDTLIRRWNYSWKLGNPGLLESIVRHLREQQGLSTDYVEPPAITLLNSLPPDLAEGKRHQPIDPVHWDNMLDLDLVVSGERLAWRKASPAWSIITKAFPKAIDARSYIHGLYAGTIAGGFLPEVSVRLKNLTTMVPVGEVARPNFEGVQAGIKAFRDMNEGIFVKEYLKGLRKTTWENLPEVRAHHIDAQGNARPDDEAQRLRRQHSNQVKQNLVKGLSREASALFQHLIKAPAIEVLEGLRDIGLLYLIEHYFIKREMLYNEKPMGDDGSGRYHPDHPDMAYLVEKHGKVAFQIRALGPQVGLFAKGIIIPDYRCVDEEGNPTIDISWNQVKGNLKKVAAIRAAQNKVVTRNVYIGILRAWDRPRQMSSCFELLENIGPIQEQRIGLTETQSEAMDEEIESLLYSLVDEAMEDLGKDGLNGLLASIAKDDQVLAMITKLLSLAERQGIPINPMQIDRVNLALKAKLGRRLWTIGQGGGFSGRQQVIVIDAGLEEGECVTTNFRVGTELATWRFPLVLAQGLKVLTVVKPRPHHLLQGQGISEVIYMNPRDVLDMQGDDDGDIVACSPDRRVVRLFQLKADKRRFAVEPDGVKLPHGTESPEGLAYLRTTPMGPVDKMTINRAKLLAAGDHYGALAMSVLIQEAVDKAKRAIRWSDWEQLVSLSNWREINGVWYPHWWQHADGTLAPYSAYSEGEEPEGTVRSQNFLADRPETVITIGDNTFDLNDHELPDRLVAFWVARRLKAHGCHVGKPHYQHPLGWKKQFAVEVDWKGNAKEIGLGKMVDPEYWQETRALQEGYTGGNYVHKCFDRAWLRWQDIAEEFQGPNVETDLANLLGELLRSHGITTQDYAESWAVYRKTHRQPSGLETFRAAMQRAMKMGDSEEERELKYYQIQHAYSMLEQDMAKFANQAGIQGLVNIWLMEMRPHWGYIINKRQFTTANEHIVPQGIPRTRINNPNSAVAAICWPGSPIFEILGIPMENNCPFLTEDRIQAVLKVVEKAPNAMEALARLIWAEPRKRADGSIIPSPHERATGTPVWECEKCKGTLQTALVRKFRSLKGRRETQVVGDLVQQLNHRGRAIPVVDTKTISNMSLEDAQTRIQELTKLANRNDQEELELLVLQDRQYSETY